MNKYSKKIHILSSVLIIINIITFIGCWITFSDQGSLYKASFTTSILLYITYLVTYLIFGYIFDSFAFDRRKITENLFSISLGAFLSSCIFYFLDTLAYRTFFLPWYVLIAIFFITLENVFLLKLYNRLIFNNYKKRTVIVFYNDAVDLMSIKQLVYFDIKYTIIKKIKKPRISNIDLNCETVFIAGVKSSIRDIIVKKCIEKNIELFVVPSVSDVIMSGGKYVEELSSPMYKINSINSNDLYLFLKRFFDIAVSMIALIILCPFMLISALAIKVYDGGPVLYKQVRVTKGGREFVMYKFRSMIDDAEKDGVARISTKNDNRITPIGRLIRAIRFDELPQLFNILNGDMSIVGPRPERPEIVKQYLKKYPSFNLRLQVNAGLTGYAQVYGKYNTDPNDKLKMDLFYIYKRSFLYDLKLCFMTIKILFMKESTEAIDDGKTIAGK